MIPKAIHYCWFGRGKKPELVKKCIASWKKYCPDYKIIEWNEDNFDFEAHPYAKYCYEYKKWAFLSDYVRLAVVEKYGGIYFDTDVELLKNTDLLLPYQAFYSFENGEHVNTGQGFGCEAHHATVQSMLEEYTKLVPDERGTYSLTGCPKLNTQALIRFGLVLNGQRQNVAGAEIYPVEWFNPYDSTTGRLNKTKNTVSVHWYSMSWLSKGAILKTKITKPLHRIFGTDCISKVKKFFVK